MTRPESALPTWRCPTSTGPPASWRPSAAPAWSGSTARMPRGSMARGRSRSGGALVGPDRQRSEDHEDADQPGDALQQARRDRSADRERAHRADHEGDWLVVRECLQPARHRLDRHERGADERQREQPDQPERLHRLLIADGQAGERRDAADRQPEHGREHDHGDGRDDPVGEPEAHQVPDGHDDQDRDQHPHRIRDEAAGQYRGTRHRHRTQPVDHALLQFLRQGYGGTEAGEGRCLPDDPWQQELDIRRPLDRDRTAEDIAEQQHEDNGLDDAEENVGGHAVPDDEVAPGNRERIDRGPSRAGSEVWRARRGLRRCDGCHEALRFWSAAGAGAWRRLRRLRPGWPSSSVACPVRARKTSSSDGRRSASPRVTTPAASRPRTASISASDPRPPTPTLTGLTEATASPTWPRSGTANSSTSPPICPFSSSAVPLAITWP